MQDLKKGDKILLADQYEHAYTQKTVALVIDNKIFINCTGDTLYTAYELLPSMVWYKIEEEKKEEKEEKKLYTSILTYILLFAISILIVNLF